MSNQTTTEVTFPHAPDPSITTRQRDTYMLIGFLFLSMAGIVVFLCFMHRKYRDSCDGISQWFLSVCCTSRIMRSASRRLHRHGNENSAGTAVVAEDFNNNGDGSYLNPMYTELSETVTPRNGLKHNTGNLRTITNSKPTGKPYEFGIMLPQFEVEDDSGISDVSTSPKQSHDTPHRHSLTRHLSYRSQGSQPSEGNLIKVLLPENLRHFSEEELEMCRKCPNTRFQVISLQDRDRSLQKTRDIYCTPASGTGHEDVAHDNMTSSSSLNVREQFLASYVHDRINANRHGLRRACSDITELKSENLYEEIAPIQRRSHRAIYVNDRELAERHDNPREVSFGEATPRSRICEPIEHDERCSQIARKHSWQNTGKDLTSLKRARRMSRQLNEDVSHVLREPAYCNGGGGSHYGFDHTDLYGGEIFQTGSEHLSRGFFRTSGKSYSTPTGRYINNFTDNSDWDGHHPHALNDVTSSNNAGQSRAMSIYSNQYSNLAPTAGQRQGRRLPVLTPNSALTNSGGRGYSQYSDDHVYENDCIHI